MNTANLPQTLRGMLVLVLLLIFGSGAALAQQTWYVSQDRGSDIAYSGQAPTVQGTAGPFATIQKALDAASAGDIIYVEASQLNYAVNSQVVVNKNIALRTYKVQGDTDTQVAIASGLEVKDGATVTAGTDSPVPFVLSNGADPALELTKGTLAVIDSKVRIAAGAKILRNSDAQVTGSLAFAGAVDVEYTGSASITAGPELPSNLGTGDLLVHLNGATLTVGKNIDADIIEVDGLGSAVATLTGPVFDANQIFVAADNVLNATTIELDNDADLVANGTVTGEILAAGGADLAGSGKVQTINVLVGGASVEQVTYDGSVYNANLDFTGTLYLTAGNLAIASGDLSPTAGANVIVNVAQGASATGGITGAGTFNADQKAFNLAYSNPGTTTNGIGTNSPYVAGKEFDTEYLASLLVDADNGTITAATRPGGEIDGPVTIRNGDIVSNNTGNNPPKEAVTVIFPTAATTIAGNLLVEDFAVLVKDANPLTLKGAVNVVEGAITGTGTLTLNAAPLALTGDGDVDAVTAPAAMSITNNILGFTVAQNANATVSDFRNVTGAIDTDQGATLALDLANWTANNATEYADVQGNIVLDGALFSLMSTTDVLGMVDANSGTVAFDTYLLRVTGDFDAESDVTFTGTGGVVMLTAGSNFGLAGGTIPTLVIAQDINLTSNATVGNTFTQQGNATVNAGTNDLTLKGTANLNGGVIFDNAAGDGILITNGVTADMAADVTVAGNLTITGNTTLTSKQNANVAGEEIYDLTVTETLRQDAGVFNYNKSDVLFTGQTYDYNGGSLEGSGMFVFDGVAGNGTQTLDPASAITFPVLSVEVGAGNEVNVSGTNDVVVANALWLKTGTLDVDEGNGGQLDFQDNSTLHIWDGEIGDDAADDVDFGEQMTIVYGDQGNMATAPIDLDVNSFPNSVAAIKVYDNTEFEYVTTVTDLLLVAANLDMTQAINLTGGGDSFITLATGGTLQLQGNATVVDDNNANTKELVFAGPYDLHYDDYTAPVTAVHFPSGGEVMTLTVDAPAGGLTLPATFNRTVDSLSVVGDDNVADPFLLNGNTLSVNGGFNFANNTAAVTGGTIRFVGSESAVFQLAADYNVGTGAGNNAEIVLSKSADAAVVTLMGGNLNYAVNGVVANLDEGILATSAGTKVVLWSPSITPANPSPSQGYTFGGDDTVGYIAGTVEKAVTNNPLGAPAMFVGRVSFPVGDMTGKYSPIDFVFDAEANQGEIFQTTLQARFVNQAPGGEDRLPVTGIDGQTVRSTSPFYWVVEATSDVSPRVEFAVEATRQGYADQVQAVNNLRLLRRSVQLPIAEYLVVGTEYSNFVNQDLNAVTVVALNATGGLRRAGSVFTYGLPQAPVTGPTQVASVQFIHNAPAGGAVDVYVDGTRVADDLNFREATAFVEVGLVGTIDTVTVALAAGTSTDASNPIAVLDEVILADGEDYVGIAINDPSGAGVVLDMYEGALQTSTGANTVALAAYHGALQAQGGAVVQPVDISLFQPVPGDETDFPLFSNLAYGEIADYTSLDAASFVFQVTPAGTDEQLYAARIDLAPFAGQSAIVLASGYLTPPATRPTTSFDLIVVGSNGSVIVPTDGQVVTDTEDPAAELPQAFAVSGNYPNPFNPSTSIQFDLPATAEVSVEIFDMLGRRVMDVPVQTLQAGANRTIQVDASQLASGLYVYRVVAKMANDTKVGTGRMTLVK